MSFFKRKDKSAPQASEPQSGQQSYYSRPEDDVPDEYEANRRDLFAPPAGGSGRGPSPRPMADRYGSNDGYDNNNYNRNDNDYGSSKPNVIRRQPPPPSAETIARQANSVSAMPDRYNRSGGPNDAYSRGARDLDKDRAALFAGASVKPGGPPGGRFQNGPSAGGDGEGEDEEDLETLKTKTKDIKQQSVQSTRDALRMMREAQETGIATMNQLGKQSEQLGNTERHLDVSKGFIRRADDNTNDIKTLNRSIFIPAITFDKSKKRAEQEAKLNRRYEEERAERDATLAGMQETNSRIGNATRAASSRFNRDGPPGEDDEEGLGYRAGRVNPARKAQFSRYQTGEEGESDDEREAEIDDNLNEILQGVKGLKMLASAQGDEVERQNKYLTRLHEKAGRTDQDLQSSTDRMRRI